MALDKISGAASWIDIVRASRSALSTSREAFEERLSVVLAAMEFAWQEAGGGDAAAEADRALSYAAHRTLVSLFPDETALFDGVMRDQGLAIVPEDDDLAARIGIEAARKFSALAVPQPAALPDTAETGVAAPAEVVLGATGDVALTGQNERLVTADAGANAIAGGAGNDTVLAGGGNDTVDGGAGDDVLLGQGGADILIGGDGSDRLSGGAGGDVFAFDGAAESENTVDRITDFTPGEDRVELTGFAGLTDFASLTFVGTFPEGVALSLPGGRFVVFEGISDASALGAGDILITDTPHSVTAGGFPAQTLTEDDDRYLVSGSSDDVVRGLGGDDAIDAGAGNDLIEGGAGDDALDGGAGSDTLQGGAGRDVLTGGEGADTFRIRAADDAAGGGFVLDTITDFQSGVDRIVIEGFPGLRSFADLGFVDLPDGVGIDLGGGRFVLLQGIESADSLTAADFDFGDRVAPSASIRLANDSGASGSDGITDDPALAGSASDNVGLSALEVSLGTAAGFVDILDLVDENGDFALTRATLEDRLGAALPDGVYNLVLRATDDAGLRTSANLRFTLDETPPQIVTAPTGTLDRAVNSLLVGFDGPVDESAFDVANFVLTRVEGGTAPEITSVTRVDAQTVRLNLFSNLENADYTLDVAALTDLAGNQSGPAELSFSVDALTRVVSTKPADGGQQANLDRKIVVEFDRAVNPDTIDGDAIQVLASGTALEGRLTLSSNGKIATFFPDELLPAATQLRIMVDGDAITDADGRAVDADGDGEAGGVLEADFSTVSLTPVAGTNVEGFIFDANNRDAEGNDIPLQGVVVSVVGLPDVTAVTDENGRFFLEDVPVGKVFLDFDASNVVGREGLDFGTIQRPVGTQAGQTTTTNLNGSPLSIFFAALSEGDAVQIVPGEATEAGIGANGIANLTSIFPDIDPAEWEKLKVIIPADSLTRDDGTPAEEITVMAFEPSRIPGPLPAGFDPTVVFTIKAKEATNTDGNAQIEFPNIDGLAPGTIRPILSFDHDAGEWVQTGTAIVSEDGSRLVSEGDTGVNTFGWKAVGNNPTVNGNPPGHNNGDPNCNWTGIGLGVAATALGVGALIASGPLAIGLGLAAGVVGIVDALDLFESGEGDALGTANGVASTALGTGMGLAEEGVNVGLNVLDDAALAANGGRATGALSTSTKFLGTAGKALGVVGVIGSAIGTAGEISKKAGGGSPLKAGVSGAALQAGIAAASVLDLDGSETIAERADAILQSLRAFLDAHSAAAANFNTAFNAVFGDAVAAVFPDFDEAVGVVPTDEGTVRFLTLDGGREVRDAEGNIVEVQISELAALLDMDDPTTISQLRVLADAMQALADVFIGHAPAIEAVYEQLPQLAQDTLEASTIPSEDVPAEGTIVPELSPTTDPIHYRVRLPDFETVIEQGVFEDGDISFILGANQTFIVDLYDHTNQTYGLYVVETGDPGSSDLTINGILNGSFTLSRISDSSVDFDTDGDGIVDDAEAVIGLSATNDDTDGDGVKDGAELDQGLNPLDGIGFPTGIIGSVALQGEALDVTLTGATDGSGGQTAFVATGSHGLAIVNATQFSNPILQAELDLEGTARQVAVDAARALAYVAADQGGLHVIDVSDPLAPVLVRTISIAGGAQAVVDLGGSVLIGGGQGDIALVNAVTGTVLSEIDAGRRINDFALDGDTLYAVVDNRFLASFRIDGAQITELDRIEFPQSTIRTIPEDKQVFINEGVAYVANGLEVINVPLFRLEERGGYLTYDVSTPGELSLISNIDTPRVQAGNLETIVNGSGLALVAGGFRGLQVHNAQDPGVTFDLLAEFATPGNAKGVALASGIAYVADGSGGLQVVNVLPFDANGVAPTVSFNAQAADADPGTDGIQIEEGTRVRLSLDISDDVQVRNVELLLNGTVVLNDVSAPFDLGFDVPSLASLGANTDLSVQVRATDTGGNVTTTGAVTLNVIEDITPPELLNVVPADGRLVLVGREVVSVSFSERIDPSTLTAANVTLVPVGGGDPIAPSGIVFLGQGQVAQISFDPLPLGAYEITLDLAGVTDLGGNPLGGDPVVQGFEVVDATAVWNVPEGGNWFTPENWRDGFVPTSSDGVAIILDDDAKVTINNFALEAAAQRIRLGSGTLELQAGGTLETSEIEGNGGTFLQTGGNLSNTNLLAGPDFSVLVDGFSGKNWSGVTLGADARVGGNFGGYLQFRDGNTVNGTLSLARGETSGTSRLTIYGSQEVAGTGEIRLDGSRLDLRRDFSAGAYAQDAEVVLGPDLAITGNGTISGAYYSGAFQILGQVTGDDGGLTLNYIAQRGEMLSLASTDDGWVDLSGQISDAVIETAAGSDVRLTSANAENLTLAGPGITRITRGDVDGMSIAGHARIEGSTPTASAFVEFKDSLRIDGTLEIASTPGRNARLDIREMTSIEGTGDLILSRSNVAEGETTFNEFRFLGSSAANQQEILTLAAGLTVSGVGTLLATDARDRLRIDGQVEGNDFGTEDVLVLGRLDQGGGTLSVDTTNGGVRVTEVLENAIVQGTGSIQLGNRVDLRDVTLDMDAFVGSAYTSPVVEVISGLTVNGTLRIAPGADNRTAELQFRGDQMVDGTGRIELVASGSGGASGSRITFLEQDTSRDGGLVIGEGVTIAGSGSVLSGGSTPMSILGTLEAGAGGLLQVDSINNDGAAVTVDASLGELRLTGDIVNTRITGAEGQTGEITFVSGAMVQDVILDVDARLGDGTTTQTLNVSGPLEVNSTLTLQAGTRTATLLLRNPEQLTGTGEIVLSSAGAAANPNNVIRSFNSLQSAETFTLGPDLTIRGAGSIFSGATNDLFDLRGRVIADDGTLTLNNFRPIEGTLGATDDGVLAITANTLGLTDRSTLEFGLSGSGTGRATVSGAFSLDGTLALDVADGFTASNGDVFTLISGTSTISGSFDDFTGFDLAGSLAFEMIRPDQNTVSLRVTTDAIAEARGFINRAPFVPPSEPGGGTGGDFTSDQLSELVQGGRLTGAETLGALPEILANTTLAGLTLATDALTRPAAGDVNLAVNSGLTFEGGSTLRLGATSGSETGITFIGSQEVTGTGTFLFDHVEGQGQPGRMQFGTTAPRFTGADQWVLGETIEVAGHVDLGSGGVALPTILGTLRGIDGSVLRLVGIDNDGAAVTVDARAGTVLVTNNLVETVFQGMGTLLFDRTATIEDVTLAMTTRLGLDNAGAETLTVQGGLALDQATFEIVAEEGGSSVVNFRGAQSVGGTGVLHLMRPDGVNGDNSLNLVGLTNLDEVLTFEQGVTIRGSGRLSANSAEDNLRILGTVEGEGLGLRLHDINNDGATLTADTSQGDVFFVERLSDTRIETVGAGQVRLDNGLILADVTLAGDAIIGSMAQYASQTVTAQGGIEIVDATLELGAQARGFTTLTLQGEQTITGTNGTIHLDRGQASQQGGYATSRLNFQGVLDRAEIFTIAEGVDLRGSGSIDVSFRDRLDILSDITAEAGLLQVAANATVQGDVAASHDGRLVILADHAMDNESQTRIGLDGAGLDAQAGRIGVNGSLVLDGGFAFDLGADFDAQIGEEFLVLIADEGITGAFDTITGAVIDETRGLALVQQDEAIYARVVDVAEAGQQVQRSDLPFLPFVAEQLTDVTLDAAFVGGPEALLTPNAYTSNWSNVIQNVDVTFSLPVSQFGVSRNLTISDAFTLNGDLRLDPVSGSNYGSTVLNFSGAMDVAGTGSITLGARNALPGMTTGGGYAGLRLAGTSNDAEVLSLGAGIEITGAGTIRSFSTADTVQILGAVTARGERGLILRNIDQQGEILSLDSAAGGFVQFDSGLVNAQLQIAEGADVRLIGGTFDMVGIAGPGAARISNGTFTGLDIDGTARIEGTSSTFGQATIDSGLTIDGVLELGAANRGDLFIRGTQTIDGTGTLRLGSNLSEEMTTSTSNVRLLSTTTDGNEVLTFAETLRIEGAGLIQADRDEDSLRFLGTVAGRDNGSGQILDLRRVDQVDAEGAAGTLSLDTTDGAVGFSTRLSNAVLAGTGEASLLNGLVLDGVTLDMDAQVKRGTTNVAAEGGLTVNATLSIETQQNVSNALRLFGEQTVGGTGRIALSDGAQIGFGLNEITGRSGVTEAEVFTFASGLTITGAGRLRTESSNDSLRILGTLEGSADGRLTVQDLDNGGAALTVDTSGGEVALAGRIQNTAFADAVGETGSLLLTSNTALSNVTLGMDALIDTLLPGSVFVTATDGMTVNADLTLSATLNRIARLEFDGAQTLDGSGSVLLVDGDAAESPGQPNSQLRFDGVLSDAETFVIGADLSVRGTGSVTSVDTGDILDLQGEIVADDGRLTIDGGGSLDVNGILGASDDGELFFNNSTGLALDADSTLRIGISNDGTGRVHLNNRDLTQGGTFALDIADDFVFAEGDSFAVVTNVRNFAGAFDAFEGFDLAGNLAFELVQADGDTLELRVTTDDLAAPFIDPGMI